MALDEGLIAFIETETRRLRASGRAGYLAQLITAVYLAQQGDDSLLGAFIAKGAPAITPPAEPAQDCNTAAIDAEMKGLF